MISRFQFGLIFLVLFILVSVGTAKETIRLASGEWPPYQSSSLKEGGMVTHIINESFLNAGIKVEFGYFPWNRSFYLAKEGDWDGTFIWFDTPERRSSFYVSNSVVDVKYVFFHLKETVFNWSTIDDLRQISIGATLGYEFGGKEFKEAEKNKTIKVIRANDDLMNLKLLLNKRIQVFPCDLQVGYQLIKTHFSSKDATLFTHHSKPIKVAPHHLLLSKKNVKNELIIQRFNTGLQKLKDSGKYDQILLDQKKGRYSD